MDRIGELVAFMRTIADDLEEARRGMALPVDGDMSISEALVLVRGVIGSKGLISISPDFRQHSNGKVEVNWTVYDGSKYHEGKTLSVAVNAVLTAHRQVEADPVADIARIQKELSPPLPL